MANISFGGLGNGVDFGQVVSSLVQLQRLPIDRLSQAQKTIQTKITDYGSLGTKLIALQGAASALKAGSSFDRSTATVSDPDVATVSASSSAAPGSYLLKVTQLAAAHQITNKSAKAVAATTTDIVAGASATFTFTVAGGAAKTVTLGSAGTLDDLKIAINDLAAGVNASIVNTGSESSPAYRLVLAASNTGATNSIAITADGTTLDFLNGSGIGGTDTLQAAQDATLILGDPNQSPVTLQRSTNTVTDAISGVTLSLNTTTAAGATITVNVSRDNSAVKTNIKSLITAYNDVVKFINERSTYDPVKKVGGLFLNEGTARGTLSRIRTALSDVVSGLSGTYTSVGQVGFKTERDGTIALDEAVLDGALSSGYAAVKNLFINLTGSTGVAQRIYAAVDELDDVSNGALTLRKDGLGDENARLSDQIRRKEDALTAYEARLRQQYAALDGLLRQMQTQTNFLNARRT